jgi:hypothetical protein
MVFKYLYIRVKFFLERNGIYYGNHFRITSLISCLQTINLLAIANLFIDFRKYAIVAILSILVGTLLLYSTAIGFCNINRIFCTYSSSQFISIATAMQRNSSSISHKIYYFLNIKSYPG